MRDERGVALLEVLLALVILATAGTALVALVADGLHAVDLAQGREGRYEGAGRVMTRLALRDARGLDIRLGRRVEGAFLTEVQRPRAGLYRLAVSDTISPDDELLVTVVRRAGAR